MITCVGGSLLGHPSLRERRQRRATDQAPTSRRRQTRQSPAYDCGSVREQLRDGAEDRREEERRGCSRRRFIDARGVVSAAPRALFLQYARLWFCSKRGVGSAVHAAFCSRRTDDESWDWCGQ